MDPTALAPDAGVSQWLLLLVTRLVSAGIITTAQAHTLGGLVSLLASACLLASLILPHLDPPALDPPLAGRLARLMWRIRTAIYWTIRLAAMARGNAAPVRQPGTLAVMAPIERHAEMAQLVANAVPEPKEATDPDPKK